MLVRITISKHPAPERIELFAPIHTPPVIQASIRKFQDGDGNDVVALWGVCGLVAPQNDPYQDIARKLADSPDLFFVAELAGKLMGTCMVGYEGHRGWINYLAVHPDCQRQGLATRLMTEAEIALSRRGCLKINLQIRKSNLAVRAFYESLGYFEDATLSMGKRLISDTHST